MARVALDTPLYEVIGARSAFLKRLDRLGLRTVRDLLHHFPSRYEDFSKIYPIGDLEPGQQATIQGVVESVKESRSWRRQISIVETTITDESGSIRAVWFNQPYVVNALKTGRTANFSGKVSISDEGEIYLSHPAYEVMRSGAGAAFANGGETKHTARLVPIYPETRGLTSRGIRHIMQSVISRLAPMTEWMPESALSRFGFPSIDEAIRGIHFPKTLQEAEDSRRRFSFEDLFLLQLVNLEEKMKLSRKKAPAIAHDIAKIKTILDSLPFPLTFAQKRSLWEIVKDMGELRPMNRLLQGDVGSGKTVVAIIAAMVAAGDGFQSAFMAPTEILARQHFETTEKLLSSLPRELQPPIGLLTGSEAVVLYKSGVAAPAAKKEMAKKVASGEISIVFGTHALIQKSLSFKDLGLVIVDEQHRFGVRQRAELVRRSGRGGAKNGAVPHFMSMSATPIPRTLMLTVFGDLDLSLIDELPGGRQAIETKIVPPLERPNAYKFLREEVKKGRQAFVICPRIEPAEESGSAHGAEGESRDDPSRKKIAAALDMKSVKEEYEKLKTKTFPDLRLGMLHGQMKPKEKEEVMRKFKDGGYDILVSTSVVEVGVDVRNATIMMIEGSDRFGLAQLYQFRGRVGRGEHKSYCFLMAESDAKAANARLRAIAEAKNGFELAERDLAIRGPGQFFGDVQSGMPDIAMEALRDPELVKHSREAAASVLAADPALKNEPALVKKLKEFRARIHQE